MIKNKKVGMLTLGCKVNQYESEAIAEALAAFGITAAEPDADCDAFIVNTCTVTAEADRKSRQMIRRLHAANPSAPIIVRMHRAIRSPKDSGDGGCLRRLRQRRKAQMRKSCIRAYRGERAKKTKHIRSRYRERTV